ncbi:hypothetical protein LOC67_16410 [Stieleria sp. JC731]|uniref:hypothetical protein n=1 Tax=Pirellulaceae TaxID=2691357 RepID=UPI001E36A06E|nr:hypothetical protein [Stieleria sp. JC731]MCC9602143.1 hypothetical protein [Stieleria sp. JC731]
MTLFASLREYDGKTTAPLEQLADTLPRDKETIAELFIAVEQDSRTMQAGATWILKRWNDEQEPLLAKSIPKLAKALKQVQHWEAKLHLLQILSTYPIPVRVAKSLKATLNELLSNDNKFVRAWTYSVLAAIAENDESYRPHVTAIFEKAESSDAASIKARIRQTRKKYTWARQK